MKRRSIMNKYCVMSAKSQYRVNVFGNNINLRTKAKELMEPRHSPSGPVALHKVQQQRRLPTQQLAQAHLGA